jgi:intracellular septation protein A
MLVFILIQGLFLARHVEEKPAAPQPEEKA